MVTASVSPHESEGKVRIFRSTEDLSEYVRLCYVLPHPISDSLSLISSLSTSYAGSVPTSLSLLAFTFFSHNY